MALSVFDDIAQRPDAESLKAALGPASPLWDAIRPFASSHWDPVGEEWVFSSKKAGWSVRLRHKGKIVLYLIPQEGYFLVGFVLGDRAVEEARRAGLPKAVLEQINGARKYAEGTGFRFEVRTQEDLRAVEKLARIKMGQGIQSEE
jgi:uncharacterized protein DUF3788